MSQPKPPAAESASLVDYLKAWPQYPLPHHLLSRLMLRATRIRTPAVKNLCIDTFIKAFDVDMGLALEPDAHAYPDFNSFFTRALRPDARPVVSGADEIACPVDGATSQAGPIAGDSILQAKGHAYSLTTLLGDSEQRAAPFQGGHYATLYLSPRDYHRIHLPLAGELREMVHVPGRLFSVSTATSRAVPNLFARNERVVAIFDTEVGPMAVIMVGAIFVASIETVWAGVVTPPARRQVRTWQYGGEQPAPRFAKGDEIGRFNMGSTVIVLFGPDRVRWDPSIRAGAPVRMGQLLGVVGS